MRWFVEVNSIGKTEKQSYCVAADTWQRALQFARALRSDNGPMTGFSIELLDEGFSAVDPMARLRYFVKRAPDDAALTEADANGLGTPTVPTAVKANSPPRPGQTATAAESPKAKDRSKTVAFGSSGAAVAPPASDTSRDIVDPPSAPGRGPVANVSRGPSAPRVPSTPPPAMPAQPAPPAAVAAPTAAPITPPTVPGVQLVFKREQEPDSRTPLTYREYVYAAPPGTDELIAKALLVAQFELVKASLASTRPGRLVNLAIFDVVFTGKPPVPPLVTLAWKDWKGDAVIEFPRHGKNGPTPGRVSGMGSSPAAPPPAQLAPLPTAPVQAPAVAEYQTLPSAQPFIVPRAAPAAVPGPIAAPPPPAFAPAPVFVPAPAPVFAPAPPPAPVFAPPPAPAPAFAPAPAAGRGPAPAPAPAAPPAAPPAAERAPSYPPPPPPPGFVSSMTPAGGVKRTRSSGSIRATRLRGDELITDLFEAMHDLHFLRDAIEGADFCLTLALEKMPSRAGLVHLYDIDKREFVVTCARGPGAEPLLLRRHPENDPLLAAAMRKQRATVIADASTGQAAATERYHALGGAKSVVVAPVMLAGRFLGAIELINPTDGAPYTDNEGHALTYIGEQYGEFVATRGVLLDPERIVAKPAAPLAR